MNSAIVLDRRRVLAGGGALIVSFSTLPTWAQEAARPTPGPKLPGSLNDERFLDSWIRIDAEGKIVVFTGKAELGQGIKTALIQVAAGMRGGLMRVEGVLVAVQLIEDPLQQLPIYQMRGIDEGSGLVGLDRLDGLGD